MVKTSNRIRNPESLERLGKEIRHLREQAGIPQGKLRNMRQATISKIENGGDVTLDTFISYASALGLEVSLVPVGQARWQSSVTHKAASPPAASKPVDLLTEFSDLKDVE
jgi:transcriptional regulator with XRE-family HTH domain